MDNAITQEMIHDCLYAKSLYDNNDIGSIDDIDMNFEYFNNKQGFYCTRFDLQYKIMWKIRYYEGIFERKI